MKKLLALVLVMVLALASMTACSPKDALDTVKDKTVDGFNTVKKTVGGWFGIEFEDEKDNEGDDSSLAKNYAEMAVKYLNNLYKEVDPKTAKNYDLPATVAVEGGAITLNIVWKSSVESVVIAPKTNDASMVTVTVPEVDADLAYTITATITDTNGNTKSVTYNRVVPATNTYMTPAEYYAAAESAEIKVKGIVTGIDSKSYGENHYNCLYVQDESGNGGYYVYSMTSDPVADLHISIGMTVKIVGVKHFDYDVSQVNDATVTVLDTTVKTVTPVDFTTIYSSATSLKDTALVSKTGMLVTIKGAELTTQNNGEKQQYYQFKLGALESYVRIYKAALTDSDATALKQKHTDNMGKLADVTGVITFFKGEFYLNPVSVDAFSNFKESPITDADKIAAELNSIKFYGAKKDQVIDLVVSGATYKNVTISWTSNNACAVVSADGKTLNVYTQDTEQTVILTASAKIGDMTPVTKTFELKVSAKLPYIINIVENPAVDTEYYLYLDHTKRHEDMFFTGKMSGYYFATTGTVEQAVKVKLVDAGDGKYYLIGKADGVDYYFNIVSKYDTEQKKIFNNVTRDLSPISKYEFDTTLKTLKTTTTVTDGDGKEVTKTFIFGTSASSTHQTISANYADSASSTCIAYLVTVIDVTTMTDEEKVTAQLGMLNIDTTVGNDAKVMTITLPGYGVKGVELKWSVNNLAEIKDGKLVITLGGLQKTVVLTATVTAGSVTKTKDFTFTVPKLLPIEPTYTFEEGKGYLLVGKNQSGFMYFCGTIGADMAGRIDGSADLTKAVKVYVEYADKAAGTFYIYFENGEAKTKTYIAIDGSGASTTSGYIFETDKTKLTATWSLNENNCIVSSNGGRMIATQIKQYFTYGSYATSNATKDDYFVSYLAVQQDVPELTPSEKVEDAKNSLEIKTTETKVDTTITLPTSAHSDVKITWTTDNTAVVVNNGKLVVTVPADLAEDVVVKITATLTYGEGDDAITDTKTFDLTLKYVTPADKVAEEKAALKLPLAETSVSGKLALPTAIYKKNVTITWATNNDCVAVVDGKLVVTLPEASVTVKITATIACGTEATDTKEFELKLNVPAYTLNNVTENTLATDKAYKFYIVQVQKGKNYFANGKKSGNFFGTTTNLVEAINVYLEEVKGEDSKTVGYRIYFKNADGSKTYYDVYEYKANSVGVQMTGEPNCVYVWDDAINSFKTSVTTTNGTPKTYYLGAYNTNVNIGSSEIKYVTDDNAANIGLSQYVAYLAEVVCPHAYADDCDDTCDVCGATRTVSHKYDADCDPECNLCGATRTTTVEHKDENSDGKCDNTGCKYVTEDAGATGPWVEPDMDDENENPSVSTTTTVTAKYPGGGTSTNMTEGNNAATLSLDATVFTVTSTKCGSNYIGLNKDGTLRLYASSADGNGNELTVSVADGHTIKSIKITFNITNSKSGGSSQVSVNGTAVKTIDGTTTDCEVDINASSFVLKNITSGSSTQVHIVSIEIVYA